MILGQDIPFVYPNRESTHIFVLSHMITKKNNYPLTKEW